MVNGIILGVVGFCISAGFIFWIVWMANKEAKEGGFAQKGNKFYRT